MFLRETDLGMWTKRIWLLIGVSIVLQAAPTFGQAIQGTDTGLGGANSITGTLLTPSGERVQRRIAVRLATVTSGDRVGFTDESGNFAFRGLVNGDYMLIVDKEKEYQPLSQSVTVFQMRGTPGQNFMVSLRLKAKGGSMTKPGVVKADLAGIPKEAIQSFNKAVETAKAGDGKKAVQLLEGITKEYPNFMLAFNELGVQFMRMGELEKADENLQSALRLQPDAYTPLVNRGIVLFMMKRYSDAEPGLRAAVKIEKDSAVGHYFLGQTVAYLGKFDEAEKELAVAIALGGSSMKEAHRMLAVIYNSRGDKAKFADELEEYLRLAPDAPDAANLKQKMLEARKEAGVSSKKP